MADGREEHVWSNHSEEHKSIPAYKIPDDQIMRRWLTRYAEPRSKVLDFGCGSGLWKDLFRDYEYYGYDQNPGMIKVAKERYPDSANQFGITEWNKIPFPDNYFDVIFTSSVIQHNTHEHKKEVLAEFRRILKPNGFYICTENTFRPDNYLQHPTLGKELNWHPEMEDGYSFTAQGWSIFMQENGFRPIDYRTPSEYIYQKV